MDTTYAVLAGLKSAVADGFARRERAGEEHGITSPVWYAAHQRLRVLSSALDAERVRLAKVDRYGPWRNATDKELMIKGYL